MTAFAQAPGYFPRFRTESAVALLCLVLIALVWVLAFERINYERAQTTEVEISNNKNLALAFDEHTTLSLKSFDKVLLVLLHAYAREGMRLDIRELVKSGVIDASNFSFIGMVDEHGDLSLGSEDFKPVNLADREWFKVHQQHDDRGMYIDQPLLGRITGRWAIPLSRRISKPDGSFGGVVYVAVDSAYFSRFYQKADLGEQGAVMLVGLDGIALARLAGSAISFGQDMSKSSLLIEQRKSKNGSFLSTGALDDVSRFFSYRTLSAYPLIVAVGTSKAEVLKQFYASQRDYFLVAAAGTAVILIAALGMAVVLTRKKQADFRLENSDRHFRSMIENATDLVVVIDIRGVIKYVSPSIKRVGGYEIAEIKGRTFQEFIHPEDTSAMQAGLAALVKDRNLLARAERRFRHKSGAWVTLEAIARNALDDPLLNGFVLNARDITERKTAEERIRKLNQLYATLSGCNTAIVHSTSRLDLCQHICRLEGGWVGLWIGFVDAATKRIVPEAWSDSLKPYIGRMSVSVDPAVPEGQGPTSIAARTGKPYFCNDIFEDPATLPWRQFATNFGIKSVAAVPVHLRGTFVGVANFYAAQKNFYIPEVQSLLVEVGRDISFALEMLEREEHRETAEREVAESEAKFRSLVEQTIAGIYIIQEERFVYVNPRFAEITGYGAPELIGTDVLQIVEEPYRALVRENIRKRLSGEVKGLQYTLVIRRKDGLLIDIGVHGSSAYFQGKPAIVGVMQNISERKRAEEHAQHYVAQLEKSMLGTIDAISAMVEMRDSYTAGHQRRVAALAEAIARELAMPESEIRGICLASKIHDLGKIQIPAEILSKPSRLTALEYEMIKTHAQSGYEILKGIDFPWPLAQLVYQHHERLDGTGYPRGLRGDEIMIGAKILAVADTVEAMTSHRPYRAGLGIDVALDEITKNRDKLYDASAVDACVKLFREKQFVFSK